MYLYDVFFPQQRQNKSAMRFEMLDALCMWSRMTSMDVPAEAHAASGVSAQKTMPLLSLVPFGTPTHLSNFRESSALRCSAGPLTHNRKIGPSLTFLCETREQRRLLCRVERRSKLSPQPRTQLFFAQSQGWPFRAERSYQRTG